MSKKENKLANLENVAAATEPRPELTAAAPEAEPKPDPAIPIPEAPVPPTPARLTPEAIEELRAKAAKADEYWDRLLRAAADFENYKKRSARERQDAVKYANESLLEKLIPVLDNFDMAAAAANQPQSSSVESIRTGITMIHSQLKSLVAEAGLEEIDASNKLFDANWHEAVSQQESAEVPDGHVLQQLRKGYKLRDRLLRPATVVVAKKPGA
ncbi:MAG: nucleotide exchange factor GrpE [Verrucomicrobia bacterium]|nr:nucleotide exchange factor GrpE [Verrucomicrobiota bacterium]